MGGNGSGGRNRKPKLLKVLEGDRRKIGRKKLEAIREPTARGTPIRPDYFSAEDNRIWDAVIASAPPGLLTAADSMMVEMLVTSWAMLQQTNRQIEATALLVKSERGAVKNPLMSIRRMLTSELNAAAAQLGMSPFARARLTAPTAPDDDPMAVLLGWDTPDDAFWTETKQ
jgi:P27 family predicted phage terminase small subunit